MPFLKYKVFTIQNLLMYGGITLAVIVFSIWGIIYNIDKGLEPIAWIVLVIVPLIFVLLTSLYYYYRLQFKKSIVGYTSHGVGVRNASGDIVDVVDDAVESAIITWAPVGQEDKVRDFFKGSFVEFVDHVLSYGGIKYYAWGLTWYKYMQVTWLAGTDFPYATVKHEAGHVVLHALDIPDYEHHKILVG